MTTDNPFVGYSDGEIDTNPSTATSLNDLIGQRYSRRATLIGGLKGFTVAALSGTMLAACDEDTPANNQQPTADAGADIQAVAGSMVTLQGSATDPDGTVDSVQWTQTEGPTVTLTGANMTMASFFAPAVTQDTQLVFSLRVTDNGLAVVTDEVTVTVSPALIGFMAIPKSLDDVVTVPDGYSVSILYALGDPIDATTPPYSNNGSDTNFDRRAGDHHDALYYFGLGPGGAPDPGNSQRGLLVMNHENITESYLHANGPTVTPDGRRPEAEARKEMLAHGLSIVEVSADNGWSIDRGSTFNRRITPLTPVDFSGPVAGNSLLVTQYSPDGTEGRGTINNCANGFTPWNTDLTCEENWAFYFKRNPATDNGARSAKEITAFNRYGITSTTGNYGWVTVQTADPADTSFARWNAEVMGGDATQDFRNEMNQFGWIVEIDPYDPASKPRKRTALGRFAHEGCWPSLFIDGTKPAWYMGDDNRNDYLYKFVSDTPWSAADADGTGLAIGDKYLDAGTLYVARFNEDGTGQWLALVLGQNGIGGGGAYPFADQADVLTHARLAADVAGATPMDRPEWTATNPRNGEMYLTLTNNRERSKPIEAANAANPRHYNDPNPGGDNFGNPNGHILRLKETGGSSEATSFEWDIFLFGADDSLDPDNVNLSGLDGSNEFSSPDGLWFGRPSNISGQGFPLLWIQTDDGALTDQTNNQMLVAQPGTVGDGEAVTITNEASDGTTRQQGTFVGKSADDVNLRRFLVGPAECEITGIDSTPDGSAIFVNIQHPGENGGPGNITSNWPASQGGGGAGSRPRSATIVITKDDGGIVGY